MKVTRTSTWSVNNQLKAAKVVFCLNEATPELQEEYELLATIREETTNGKSEVVKRDDPPFHGCPVTWMRRQDGTESIVMFSYQAVWIISGHDVERLAKTQTGCYGLTLGKIDGSDDLCLGLISKDKKRALMLISERKTVLDVAYVLFNSALCSDKMPHEISISELRQVITNHMPETTEQLFVRVRTAKKAFEAIAKYAVAYLEELPKDDITQLTKVEG